MTDTNDRAPAAVADEPADAEPRMTSRHRLTLAALLGATFMIAVDFSILTVSLPVIGEDLGFSLSNLQWIITAFALASAGFMLLFSRIGDRIGRRRIFLAGIAVLTVGSLIGGLAQDPGVLLAARVAQGLATAAVLPAALALLTTSFPEGPLRNKALSFNGALLSLGFAFGALLGGVLTDLLSWRWNFFVNVPVGILILICAPLVLAPSRGEQAKRLDLPGAFTVTLGLLALIYGLTGAQTNGWASAETLVTLLIAAALLTAFILIELRAPEPLAPLRVLTRKTVKWGNIAGLFTLSMQSGLSFLLTIYMQQVLGLSVLTTGLAFALLGLGVFSGGMIAPKVVARFGPRDTLILGLIVQAVATAALLLIGERTGTGMTVLLIASAISGVGHVWAVVSYTITATSALPDSEQGLATALASLTQQIGFTLGTPILSAIAVAWMGVSGDLASQPPDTILGGVRFSILVDALIVLLGAVLVAAFLRAKHLDAEEKTVDTELSPAPA
ncbi:MFS transporter [Nocardia goodfellowii]|uniref:EmrB/QacA subfamily drug resistance transporter n=1 Tax=Nocardia goodfellowii TaxID=882446 RepID=A0ABS4QHG3_9NOCA|nr:MFS transporter [Nocardia goodfellowii]MBP2191133.1 EmrB/QacA subfamily drug resistance transporter [Nocardia goodfellowii]